MRATPIKEDADPLALVARLLEAARAAGEPDATAHVLGTAAGGQPSARVLLLKGVDARGLAFFTNHRSRKASELASDPRAAVGFWWPRLRTQIVARGRVTPVDASESDAYFATRPRGSQLGAWASRQSAPVRWAPWLIVRWLAYGVRFGGRRVPRPSHWGGFRLDPDAIEVVRLDALGLAESVVYRRAAEGWSTHTEVTWA